MWSDKNENLACRYDDFKEFIIIIIIIIIITIIIMSRGPRFDS